MKVRLPRWLGAALATLVSGLAGCAHVPPPTAEQTDRGLVWLFPGIEGGPWALESAARGLRDAGIDCELRLYDWQRPFGVFTNLSAYKANREKGAEIAHEIVAYHGEHPTSPIDLIGYSGGGGLAVFAAEALPPNTHIRNLILAQAAIDPHYDLTVALNHVDGQLVNLYCPTDWLILGLGTRTFGTMDRAYGDAAGKIGFDIESAVPDEAQRRQLIQRGWTKDMRAAGHWGDHLGALAYEWNREYVAPYLLGKKTAAASQSATGQQTTAGTASPP